jgi:hypothetical protein
VTRCSIRRRAAERPCRAAFRLYGRGCESRAAGRRLAAAFSALCRKVAGAPAHPERTGVVGERVVGVPGTGNAAVVAEGRPRPARPAPSRPFRARCFGVAQLAVPADFLQRGPEFGGLGPHAPVRNMIAVLPHNRNLVPPTFEGEKDDIMSSGRPRIASREDSRRSGAGISWSRRSALRHLQ